MDKKKIKNIILNLDLYIAGLSFAVIVLVTFCGVLMRYVFHNPFVWEEEVQVGLFLWVVFFGGIEKKKKNWGTPWLSPWSLLPLCCICSCKAPRWSQCSSVRTKRHQYFPSLVLSSMESYHCVAC